MKADLESGEKRFFGEEEIERELACGRLSETLAAARREGFFKGYDGCPLFFVTYTPRRPRGTVVILHGFTESTEKYRELAYYFLSDGLAVCLFDQRGHGRSANGKTPFVHIETFSEYVRDLAAFSDAVVGSFPAPHYLFAHSMGGAVGALYLERGDRFFRHAILSSPMIAPQHGKVPTAFCLAYCRLMQRSGRGGEGVRAMRGGEKTFEESSALSRARFEAYRAVRRENPTYPCRGGTYAWSAAALGVTRAILRRGAPENIRIPLRVYAAEHDALVQSDAQKKFVARVPQGALFTVRGAKHEIFSANDAVLHPYLSHVLGFFKERSSDEDL